MDRVAVLTSGGDAPGMNAAIRSVVRSGLAAGLEIVGVTGGWRGVLEGAFHSMHLRSVSNSIQRGGTLLRCTRSDLFRTEAGLHQASDKLRQAGIGGLVAIGGDGTFRGCLELAQVWEGALIGIPGTIDNDIYGTDHTIGFDTAVNTAVDAIDKIRDTADAHELCFLVEVMGRKCGAIALDVAIATGAEEVLLPEKSTSLPELSKHLLAGKKGGKTSSLVVVAEGAEEGNAFEIAHELEALSKSAYRVVVLGHLLRGGAPSAFDRLLASELGKFAIDLLQKGKTCVMAGKRQGKLVATPLTEATTKKKGLSPYLLNLHPILSR